MKIHVKISYFSDRMSAAAKNGTESTTAIPQTNGSARGFLFR